jgi:hypothetical protein
VASFVFNTTRNPLSGKRERKTVSNAAVGLTESAYTLTPSPTNTRLFVEPRKASAAILQVLTQAVTFTIDGTTPVAGSVGFEAAASDFIYLDSYQKIKEFKAIRSGGSDGAIEAAYLFGA